jgi:ABC-type multidrug transport system ATPase subunit
MSGKKIPTDNLPDVAEGPESMVQVEFPKSKSFGSKSLGEAEKTGVQITLYDLTYRIPLSGGEERYLLGGLEPLCGTLDPGNMIALMGSSGAGKSTLMDVISKRKTVGIVSGLVLFDGHEPTHAEIGRDTGYVEQQDTLWGTFTVREMMMYTALLKMSSKFSRQQKAGRVDEVIEQMGLTKSKDTKIGGAMVRGVSGGEAKRISVGLGLLNNPRILFLDEPTSGLDSATSVDVMGTVKQLAEEGRTVLTTIHQPSGKIFSYYDGLLLLSRDVETRSGNIVYFGEAGKVAKQYFMDMGYKYDPDEVDNIAEYAINIISGGVSGPQGGNTLINHYHESDLGDLNHNISEGIARPLLEDAGGDGGVKDLKKSGGAYYANGFMSEFFTIFSYKGKNQFTDVYFLASRIALYAVAALLLVSLYGTPNAATPGGLIIVISVIFITIFITGIITIIYIPGLIIDKPVFIRESNDGCYRTISYTCANFLIEAIAVACSSIAYTCVLYWAIEGLNTDVGAFFFFMFTHFVYSLTACVITLTIAAPLPSIEVSAGAVAVYALLNVAIMGFLSQVPVWWGWACFISYMRWGFGALMINQFEDVSIDLCGDVKNPLSLTEILDLAGSMDNLESQGSSLNVNDIVCGFVQIPTMSSDDIFSETCANITSFAGGSGNIQSLATAFGCNANIIKLLSEPMSEEAINDNLGTAILSFFPQGENYDAHWKFIQYDKWWCVGFLACIFVVFFGAYWYSSKLSIRLVKR